MWDRCDAECSPQRGFYYHPSRHSAGQPIVVGWAYQFIARLNFIRESWTAPVDVLRVHPMEDANEVAAEQQVKGLLGRLGREEVAIPLLFVFDAGYDPVKLQQGLEGSPCQISSSACGRAAASTPIRASSPAARPHRTSASPRAEDEVRGPEHLARTLCKVHVRRCRLRGGARARLDEPASEGPRTRRTGQPGAFTHRGRDARVGGGSAAASRREAARAAGVLWLWWHGGSEGATPPDLDLLWRAYVRRFELLEHTPSDSSSRPWGGPPRAGTPPRAGRPVDVGLVVAAYTQLRLARPGVTDLRLPWERRYDPERLTPVRVHRVEISTLLARLGTPAKAPKPCGRSPGRPKGRLSGRAKRYPAVKKSA